jgi:hypothetical protein
MTVVCAVRDGNVILMSADTAATSEDGQQTARSDSKMFRLYVPCMPNPTRDFSEMLVGFSGEYYRAQLIGTSYQPPKCPEDMDAWKYLVSVFMPSLRKFLAKYFTVACGDNILGDANLLIAFRWRMFVVYGDGQVEENTEDFVAIGENKVAMGALWAGSRHGLRRGMVSWEVLDSAMEASEYLTSVVRKPFQTEVLFS